MRHKRNAAHRLFTEAESGVRVAVSGTHGCGKSELIAHFLARHADYIHEPEPYEWLQEMQGEDFSDEPTADDYYRQLEFSVQRVCGYEPGDHVIFERSPLDFVAYLKATRHDMLDSAVELAAEGISHLDLIVFLPLDPRHAIVVPDAEDLALRDAVNDYLIGILLEDELELLGSGPRVVEVRGRPMECLLSLERECGLKGARE